MSANAWPTSRERAFADRLQAVERWLDARHRRNQDFALASWLLEESTFLLLMNNECLRLAARTPHTEAHERLTDERNELRLVPLIDTALILQNSATRLAAQSLSSSVAENALRHDALRIALEARDLGTELLAELTPLHKVLGLELLSAYLTSISQRIARLSGPQ